LKKVAFILLLFICPFGWGQQFIVTEKPKQGEDKTVKKEETIVTDEKEYNALLTYTPKPFVSDLKSKPENQVLLGDLNTIGSLELRYAYREQLKLNEKEINWLENEIVKLATAFFNEGTPILIQRAGDYVTCTGKGLETRMQDNQRLTVLHFCYVCAGAAIYEDRFLEIFNKKTESLMAAKKLALANKTKSRSTQKGKAKNLKGKKLKNRKI